MKYLKYEEDKHLGILKIDRPDALNALNKEVLLELDEFLSKLSKNDDLRALILTGSGEKAFAAGADIREMHGLHHLDMLRFCELGHSVARHLEDSTFFTIAAVNGFALGGGLELALACDFIYASPSAKLGLPEVTLGIIPGFGGTQRLARAVGTRQAKELVMSGRIISAETAFDIGLVNRICDNLLEECRTTALEILSNSFVAVMQAKTVINHGSSVGLEAALNLEKQACAVTFATHDRYEGMNAFIEKRTPEFI